MKEIKERIRELAAEMSKGMVELAQRAIQCPSLSGEEQNVAKIFMEAMEGLGYDEVFSDRLGNVVGVVRGTEDGPTIMYNGHMDHVDTGDYSEWGGYDPYGGAIDEDEMFNEAADALEKTRVIHGRAASDTKCGIACQITSGGILAALKREGYSFRGNYVVTAVVYEEPAEQIGMIELLERTLPEKGIRTDGVVSCEATSLKLYLGHRGRVEMQVEVSGVTSHASAPWLGMNAVNKATKLITRVEERFPSLKLHDDQLGDSSIALTIISCKPGSMCIVPDRCLITYDRRLVPSETAEDAVRQMKELIDEIAAEDPDFRAEVKVAAVPRTTYTGITITRPNIKEAWKIGEDHPFVKACAEGLRSVGEPVGYAYWDFGTALGVVCGKYRIAGIGYSPMQEYYCHRPVDKCRIDFMERALVGNVAIFEELTKLGGSDFSLA